MLYCIYKYDMNKYIYRYPSKMLLPCQRKSDLSHCLNIFCSSAKMPFPATQQPSIPYMPIIALIGVKYSHYLL